MLEYRRDGDNNVRCPRQRGVTRGKYAVRYYGTDGRVTRGENLRRQRYVRRGGLPPQSLRAASKYYHYPDYGTDGGVTPPSLGAASTYYGGLTPPHSPNGQYSLLRGGGTPLKPI